MSFSFGAPSSAPATGGLSSGFSFGANKPATASGFGLPTTSQPSTGLFGASATPAPAFGAATPGTGFGASSGFGNTSAFGASAAPAFGATSTASAFGTPGATSAFGATSTAPAFGTTPAFGATSTAPAFGATATPSFGTSAAPAFGSTAAPAFGQTSTAGFGTGGLNFGASSNQSTAATGLTLGGTITTSSGLGGLGGFGFGGPTTQSTALGGGLFGTTTSSTGLFAMFLQPPPGSPIIPITQTFQMLPHTDMLSSPMAGGSHNMYTIKTPTRDSYKTILPSFGAKLGTTNVTGTQPSASAAPSLGLGGIAPVGAATTTTSGDGKTEPPKQAKLPNEIATTVDTFKDFVKKQKSLSSEIMRVSIKPLHKLLNEIATTVDAFKDFVKKQKSLSSEIMRVSIKPLHKVAREAEATLRMALSLSGEVCKARAHSRRLRSAAAAALAAAETVNNSTGTELEGPGPPSYVNDLISELEQQLIAFRRQMDVADKQMQASPKLLTEQELTLGIRRMHGSLVALAGSLQAAHAQVQEQKERYLNLRKYVLKDPTNVFDTAPASTSLDQILWDAEGSRKKAKPNQFVSSNPASAVLSDPRAALGNLQQLAGPTPFTYIGSTLSPFPNPDASSVHWQPAPSSFSTSLNASFPPPAAEPAAFQLQKPPGKRGKQ